MTQICTQFITNRDGSQTVKDAMDFTVGLLYESEASGRWVFAARECSISHITLLEVATELITRNNLT